MASMMEMYQIAQQQGLDQNANHPANLMSRGIEGFRGGRENFKAEQFQKIESAMKMQQLQGMIAENARKAEELEMQKRLFGLDSLGGKKIRDLTHNGKVMAGVNGENLTSPIAKIKPLDSNLKVKSLKIGGVTVADPNFKPTVTKLPPEQKKYEQTKGKIRAEKEAGVLDTQGNKQAAKKQARLDTIAPKRTEKLYDEVATNNSLRTQVDEAREASHRVKTGLGGAIQQTALKYLDADNPVLGDWQKIKSLLSDAQLLYTAKTKGAISDKEMELFARAAANEDIASIPKIMVVLDNMLRKLNNSEDAMFKSYNRTFDDDPYTWDDLESNRIVADKKFGDETVNKVLVGTVEDGYRFKGGDPADAKNWEKQ